jgi:hypothetical protein
LEQRGRGETTRDKIWEAKKVTLEELLKIKELLKKPGNNFSGCSKNHFPSHF